MMGKVFASGAVSAFGALHRDIRVRAVGCSWSDRRNDGTFLLLTINIWGSIFTVLSLCL